MKIQQNPSDYLLNTSREYAIYVCEHRSIPLVSDGLKDSQRKALWILKPKSEKIKTISLAGEMISSGLYLHGDVSAAMAVSMLAAPYCNNIPLIEGVGTFGTRVAPVEGIGAPRYTSVKKNKATKELVYRDLDIISYKENYDGSTFEPISFLPIIPLVLLNSISGIAVGWSTEILPRTLHDIINTTLDAIDEKKKLKVMKPKYDYLDVDVNHVVDNTWEFTGKLEIVDATHVLITELPPDLTLDKFKKRLMDMEDDGKISDFSDKSTNKIKIEIKFKRGILKNFNEEKLIKLFKLRTKKSERIVVIDWDGNSIKQYDSAEQLVRDFVEWRFAYYIERYKKLLQDTNYELNFWLGVKECFKSKLPSKLQEMKNKQEVEKAVQKITKTLSLDSSQIDRIVSFPSYNWTKEYYRKCNDKIQELTGLKRQYTKLLANPKDIKAIFRQEVADLKKVF